MSITPDLVSDSELSTQFHDRYTNHYFPEIDSIGRRFHRKECWRREKHLGEGGGGRVYLEQCMTPSAKKSPFRVIKVIKNTPGSKMGADYTRELETIAKFSQHRYNNWFVKSFGWFKDSRSIFIAMEYCQHGDLQGYISNGSNLSLAEVQNLTYQILEGLNHMHVNGFAHRDLKPKNILIKKRPPWEEWWVVLADFGISKRARDEHELTTPIRGTAGFMAPELLEFSNPSRPRKVSEFQAADMWAFGEVVFRLLTCKVMFNSMLELMKFCDGIRPSPVDQLPPEWRHPIREFLSGIVRPSPHTRMNTSQCLEHSWMQSRAKELKEFSQAFSAQTALQEPSRLYESTDSSASWTDLSAPKSYSNRIIARKQIKQSWMESQTKELDGEFTQMPSEQTALQESYGLSESISNSPRWTNSPTTGYHSEGSIAPSQQIKHSWMKLHSKELDGEFTQMPSEQTALQESYGLSESINNSPRWTNPSATASHPYRTQSHESLGSFKPPTVAAQINSLDQGYNSSLVSVNPMVRTASWLFAEDRKFLDSAGHVSSMIFSCDGTLLASGSKDGNVSIWNIMGPEGNRMLKSHKSAIVALAISPRNNMIVSASKRPMLPDGATLVEKVVSASKRPMLRLESFPDGTTLVEKDVNMFHGNHDFTDLTFLPDGSNIAARCIHHDCVHLIDSKNFRIFKTIKYPQPYRLQKSSPNGETVAIFKGEGEGLVELLDGRTGAIRKRLRCSNPWVVGASFSSDAQKLLFVTTKSLDAEDSDFELWDIPSSQKEKQFSNMKRRLNHHKEKVTETNVSSKTGVDSYTPGWKDCRCLVLSPNYETIASISFSKEHNVILWDVQEGRVCNYLEGHNGQITSLAFSPDSTVLASGSEDSTIILWRVQKTSYSEIGSSQPL